MEDVELVRMTSTPPVEGDAPGTARGKAPVAGPAPIAPNATEAAADHGGRNAPAEGPPPDVEVEAAHPPQADSHDQHHKHHHRHRDRDHDRAHDSAPAPAPAPQGKSEEREGERRDREGEKRHKRKKEKKSRSADGRDPGSDSVAANVANPLSGSPPAGPPGAPQRTLAEPPMSEEPNTDYSAPPTTRSSAVAQLICTVVNMSPVTSNVEIVHPLVRIWLVDGDTGQSLVSSPVVPAPGDPSGSAVGAAGKRPQCGLVFPFDLRMHESRSPEWNEEVGFPLERALADFPKALLLFELLDFGATNIQGEPIMRRSVYPIAWAFLRLTDAYSRSCSGQTKDLQLFRAPQRRSWWRSIQVGLGSLWPTPAAGADLPTAPPTDPMLVPAVFGQYCAPINRQDLYPGTIRVGFRLEDPQYTLQPTNATLFEFALLEAFQRETGEVPVATRSTVHLTRRSTADESPYWDLDFTRKRGERSVPPDTPIHTKAIAARVTAVAMSLSGRLLAVGSTSEFETLVTVYEVFSATMSVAGLLRGHLGHCHDVNFQRDESALVSASSDGTAKVWGWMSLPCVVGSSVDEVRYLRWTLAHGCPVYGADFGPKVVVTAGYDTHLWLWSLDTGALITRVATPGGYFTRHLHVDAAQTKLWALDSRGSLSVWRIMKEGQQGAEGATASEAGQVGGLALRRRVECNGATTLSVGGNTAVLHSPSENLLVVVEGTTYKVTHRITGVPSEASALTTAADGKTAVMGTAEGRFLAWDVEKGEWLSSRIGTPQTREAIHSLTWAPLNNVVVVVSPFDDGRCTVSVLGRRRTPDSIVQDSDPNAVDAVRMQFGGEVRLGKGAQILPGRPGGQRDGGVRRSREVGASALIRSSDEELPSKEHRRRIEQILRYWTNRVARTNLAPQ